MPATRAITRSATFCAARGSGIGKALPNGPGTGKITSMRDRRKTGDHMRTTRFVLALSVAIALSSGVSMLAHHAFGGEFDANRPVLLRGAVTKVEWVNPHAWIHLTAKEVTIAGEKKTLTAAGEDWAVEGGTPNTLLRRGITR